MNGLTTALNMAAVKLYPLLSTLRHYVVHEDGSYSIADDGIQAFANEPISQYVDLPTNYRYYIPWDIDVLYEGIAMLEDMIKQAIPVAFWIFLILTGVYLVFNIIRALAH